MSLVGTCDASMHSAGPSSAANLKLQACGHCLAQVFIDASAAQQASFSDSPALLLQEARAAVKDVMSQMASADQEPSLAAATAAATASKAAHRAVAAEALLGCLILGLAESTSQVCASPYVMDCPQP